MLQGVCALLQFESYFRSYPDSGIGVVAYGNYHPSIQPLLLTFGLCTWTILDGGVLGDTICLPIVSMDSDWLQVSCTI